MRLCSKILFALVESPLFRSFARYLVRHLKPRNDVSVKVQGHTMYANTLDRILALFLWKFCVLEDVETNILKNVVKERMVAVDVGANIGYHTLQFAKLVGSEGKVFAFEPAPDNYSLLVKNIKANNYENVIQIRKAVSSKTGRANLFLCEEHRGDHRIFDSQDSRNSIEIETIALDDFFMDKDPIDIIKMDIQGAEYLALLGMKKLICRNGRLVLITEFSPSLLRKCGFSAEQFISTIIDYGFKLQFIDEEKKCIEPVTSNDLIKMCDGGKYVNLYLEK